MTSGGAGASAQLAVADNLKMLPVLVLGLLKNVSLGLHPFYWRGWMLIEVCFSLGFVGWSEAERADPA
jgi:hypothetical protein